MNAVTKDKLKPSAIPTIFNVPNPPKLLTSKRRLPKKRLASATATSENNPTTNVEDSHDLKVG